MLFLISFLTAIRAEDRIFVSLSKEFLNLLHNESHYNRYATPTQIERVATNVSLSMFIEGISSFSAQTMDFSLDIYFQQEWVDGRLSHNNTAPILVKDKKVFDLMWHPDVYFANARSAAFQDVTDDNFLVWVYPDGRVWYDTRISLVSSCNMDLWKYPLDSQECALRALSCTASIQPEYQPNSDAYPQSVLRLKWTDKPNFPAIDYNKEITMPDMKLTNIGLGTCNGTYATGNWSCLKAVFYVRREIMHHIMQTYIPTSLIVVISWFNFWLDVDSAAARVSLSITTLLTISTQANAVKLALPEVSYMKAIDVWMGFSMAFVFSVMIEFTVCHYAKNREIVSKHIDQFSTVDTALSTLFGPMKETSEEDYVSNGQLGIIMETDNDDVRHRGRGPSYPSMGVVPERLHRKKSRQGVNYIRQQVLKASHRAMNWTHQLRKLRGRRVAMRIDQRCRVIYPTVFLAFNLAYWSYYIVLT